jgi:hypothetical protein
MYQFRLNYQQGSSYFYRHLTFHTSSPKVIKQMENLTSYGRHRLEGRLIVPHCTRPQRRSARSQSFTDEMSTRNTLQLAGKHNNGRVAERYTVFNTREKSNAFISQKQFTGIRVYSIKIIAIRLCDFCRLITLCWSVQSKSKYWTTREWQCTQFAHRPYIICALSPGLGQGTLLV